VNGDVTLEDDSSKGARAKGPIEVLALVVVWCTDDPSRVGTVAFLPASDPGPSYVLGRGPPLAEDPHPRLTFGIHRPSGFEPVPPLAWRKLSRIQLRLHVNACSSLELENAGRCRLLHNGAEVRGGTVEPGDVLQVGSRLLLLCVRRCAHLALPAETYPGHAFGEPDAFGIVGESPVAWKLRQHLAYVASRTGHVLIRGASGTGKELAARAVHGLSRRADRPLVSRNAATIPESIADAELFGNVKDYPNVGTPARPGLFGEAAGTTLFLDEFAELPAAVQPRLLRVLDDGEYQRLGSSRAMRSDVRVVAATNRTDSALKYDLVARFRFRFGIPDLRERREDIPFLARHLITQLAGDWPLGAGVSLSCEQMTECIRKPYQTNVRELEQLLWSFATAKNTSPLDSNGDPEPDGLEDEPAPPLSGAARSLGRAEIQRALDSHNGLIESAWRALGLKNRHVLTRLMAKHGVEVRRRHGK
jgi:DNA-binding NtrC family response regulator